MNPMMTYRARRLDTASPLQLLIMLYQELIRRVEVGAMCIDDGEPLEALPHFFFAREILTELIGALDPSAAEKLCGDLSFLYGWSMAELSAAGREGSAARARSVVRVIQPLLEGFEAVNSGAGR